MERAPGTSDIQIFQGSSRSEEALTRKSVTPLSLSLFMSLMVAAAQRKRSEWSIRPATFPIEIINSVSDLRTETLISRKIGDNYLVTIHRHAAKLIPPFCGRALRWYAGFINCFPRLTVLENLGLMPSALKILTLQVLSCSVWILLL